MAERVICAALGDGKDGSPTGTFSASANDRFSGMKDKKTPSSEMYTARL